MTCVMSFLPFAHQTNFGLDLCSSEGDSSHPPSPAVPPMTPFSTEPPPSEIRDLGFCLKIKPAAGSHGPAPLNCLASCCARGSAGPASPYSQPPTSPHVLLMAMPPQVTKGHIKLLLIIIGPTVVTVGTSVVTAALSGHRSCPAAHPEGLPQGFTPHTPTEIWLPHKTQPPPEQLSCSCCHPEISTKNSFQQHLLGVWSHGRVVPTPPLLLHATLSRKAEMPRSELAGRGGGEFNSPSPESPGQAVSASQRHSAKATPGFSPSAPDE